MEITVTPLARRISGSRASRLRPASHSFGSVFPRASERPRRPVFEACRCRPLHENAPEHARRGCVIIASIIALIRETARAGA